jgi:hypothetical protein
MLRQLGSLLMLLTLQLVVAVGCPNLQEGSGGEEKTRRVALA